MKCREAAEQPGVAQHAVNSFPAIDWCVQLLPHCPGPHTGSAANPNPRFAHLQAALQDVEAGDTAAGHCIFYTDGTAVGSAMIANFESLQQPSWRRHD